jgi:hypothetical protein
MSRSLESRIGRLEQSSGVRDPNRVFVMWRRPDQDEDAVLQAAADQGYSARMKKEWWSAAIGRVRDRYLNRAGLHGMNFVAKNCGT